LIFSLQIRHKFKVKDIHSRILRRPYNGRKVLLENSRIYVIKGKGYPTLVVQVTDPSITVVTGE